MDTKVIDILVNNLSEDWERFARCSKFKDDLSVNALIGHINDDEVDIKSKMKCLLKNLYEQHPTDYKAYINKSLMLMDRNDVLQSLSILDLSIALKHFYIETYSKVDELQPPLKAPVSVDLLFKFVDLCVVDAASYQKDVVSGNERDNFLKSQVNYEPIPYSKIFIETNSRIIISGIAGIGKTWLLRKVLLDWSKSLIWNNVDFLFYLECRKLNQHETISNINELLNVFYKDIVKDFDISKHSVLFIIDGLDELRYLNEFTDLDPSCNYPIVKALLEVHKYKFVIAGRVYAIDQYQTIFIEHKEKLTIQIMGFNANGINDFIENNVIEEKREAVKATLNESPIAKSMASVPFYLSSMCKIISDSNKREDFLTMTDLYANIFLYFLQKHIIKNNGLVYQMMESENNKKYILNICRIDYELFIENKFVFSREEILLFISNFDELEKNLFGFIERIETHLGYFYQFAHLTIMEFCASVYVYNKFSFEEIIANKKLRSCLPMICGLTNRCKNNMLKFLVNLEPSKIFHKDSLPLFCYIDLRERTNKILFIECFYESQSSFTNEIKSIVDKQKWTISINEGKTTYATSIDYYFINDFINSGTKLSLLDIDKKNLSVEEKNLLVKCLTHVCLVEFNCPINFEGCTPKDMIECLEIRLSKYLISKKDFENFLPWINLSEDLYIFLHDDINFNDVYEWIRCSNIKKFGITYCQKYYCDLRGLYFMTWSKV